MHHGTHYSARTCWYPDPAYQSFAQGYRVFPVSTPVSTSTSRLTAGTNRLTSSSKSTQTTPLASLISSSNSIALPLAVLNPLLPLPSAPHPGTPLEHSTFERSRGMCASPSLSTTMARRSGKPSRSASPGLRPIGMGGVNVTSERRREDVLGIISESGMLTNVCRSNPRQYA